MFLFKKRDYAAEEADYEEDGYYSEIKESCIRRKRKRRFIAFFSFLLVGIVVISIYLYNEYKVYGGKTILSTDVITDPRLSYSCFQGNYIKFAKDGAICFDKLGKQVFDIPYQMKKPRLYKNKNFFVIYDSEGNTAYLCNEKRNITSFKVDMRIMDAFCTEDGIVALLSYDSEKSKISYFNQNKVLLAEAYYPIKERRFPVDVIMTSDYKSVISLINVKSGSITSDLEMYDFKSSADKDDDGNPKKIDNKQSSRNYILHLFSDDSFASIAENRIGFYSDDNINDLSLSNKPKSILFGDDKIAIISADGVNNYKVFIYDSKGNLNGEFNIDIGYDNAFLSGDYIGLYKKNEFYLYNLKGRLKYRMNSNEDIRSVEKFDNTLDFIITYENSMEVIHIK